ncbi:MAG: DUF3786 domain-containing protein [Syntrophales bacterium]|nr:DUF3786 domain-containing protein [Syntrophales bacterium]
MAPIIFPGQSPESLAPVIQDLTGRLTGVDFARLAGPLGAEFTSGNLLVSSFAHGYRVSGAGILDSGGRAPAPKHAIVLAYYVLEGGSAPLSGKWAAFRDFKEAAFFMPTFQEQVEQRIAREFQGRLELLKSCSQRLGGRDYPALGTGDLCHLLPALPRVPLLLVFHDGDEEFPASATVLYDLHSTSYLNVECLGVLGAVLADLLLEEKSRKT